MEISECDAVSRHPRAIIHLDVDCFYAQVEMVRHPEFKGKPLGVQQKNIVVTSNYAARQYGIKKLMLVEEALLLCPHLVLVRGEDLTNYRKASAEISEILLRYTPLVERLGLDESFIDVSAIVERWSSCIHPEGVTEEDNREEDSGRYSKIFGATEEECPCGCHRRLRIAAKIAAEMRERILKQVGLTCSAGIAHNKLLAKLGGSLHKPNEQTVVYPWAGASLLSKIGSIAKIPGIGAKTLGLLESKAIRTVDDLRRITLEELESRVGGDLSKRLKDNAEGIDETIVKPSGRPNSIGLEDGCGNVSLVGEVESRLSALLRRLVELANEDGRIPLALKITVRKSDFTKSGTASKRETRQCALPQHLLPSDKSGLYDNAKILALAMKLFHRAVDVTKPFHLTLLGVAFTKFEERMSGRSSITSFLRKQVAVQSVLDISSEGGVSDTSIGSPMSTNQDSNDASELESRCSPQRAVPRSTSLPNHNSRSISRNLNFDSSPCNTTDGEDFSTEIEPSPKKTKLEVWLNGRRESPSNEMAGLRLGPSSPISNQPPTNSAVFKSIPLDLDREVTHSWQATGVKTKPNNILKYFIANK
ncbi:DNA polymerase iota [Venturia canescens]|uniref:DNA polymerase iota n=1 Tax=Venturia canescens TaxID=32260 RepID=UPI001C9D077C|nr:DNA polymerase iota [Venturia canescens]XP_043277887.1 DNA polymerase iota [Venturia canescens]